MGEKLLASRSIVYMVGTDEESFEWLDVNKSPEEVRILQDTVNVLDLPRPPEVRPCTGSCDALAWASLRLRCKMMRGVLSACRIDER